jgi:hypothetical protein
MKFASYGKINLERIKGKDHRNPNKKFNANYSITNSKKDHSLKLNERDLYLNLF